MNLDGLVITNNEIQRSYQKNKEDGWYFVRQVGSHQQYHHKTKKGTVKLLENRTMKFILKH